MIYGIGTDIVAIDRLARMYARHGEKAVERLLAPSEIAEFRQSRAPGRFLAKRFAAKEAFSKALGTGVRHPAGLTDIIVGHDALGKPILVYSRALGEHMAASHLSAHLTLSDEKDYAVAFVVIECTASHPRR